ncbi:MAG: reverse transcriptase family protein, partial [Candidatus Thiodiazotropha endolucinida]|nr:reverse transcriptase family protein [Candidatus Thiodiazotropha taylori]MCW4261996.1 reverse transcriptase family protein [Candidatus Thiodiazotropha endolucinida]
TYKVNNNSNDDDNNNNNNNDVNNNNNNNNNDNTEFIPNDIEFTINDQLFLETLLIMIRGETIKYSSMKKKESIQEEIKVEKEIVELENKINSNASNIQINDLNNLEEKKNRLYEIRQKKMEGVLLRSRCRYEDLGEKPTKYFLNLESRNFTSKVISKLTNEHGDDFTDTSDILNYQKSYFNTLYSETVNVDDITIAEQIGQNPRKLSHDDSLNLEGEITYAELLNALKKMQNCKSPGNDGFTSEFFKFFWSDMGVFILRSLNYSYRTDSLSITQKQGIITCIPKPNKPRHLLKNWRPISLLNVIYKLASSVIANRIKSVLNDIVHEDQKGFIAGRFIGENIREIYDVLFETKEQNIPGLLLSIDFQQAFDSVSWKFILKTLDYFNFGPSIKKWIKLFQNGAESCILQNGFLSDFFYLQRGCRQGDPISPYLFILCAEVLSIMMRNENAIKGIDIDNKSFLLSQYADDTQIFLNGSETSLKATLGILKKFYFMSGLKINEDKTKALWIGSMAGSDLKLCHNYNLDWQQGPIKILGVIFTPEVFNIWDLNSTEAVRKTEKTLLSWSKRKLTLPGKITVIKSLAFSKFIHLFTSLPNPPEELVKQLENFFYKFLWNSGPDRISRNVMIQDVKEGGLRMIKIDKFIDSLKVTWLRRILVNSNEQSWSRLSRVDFRKLIIFGDGYAKHCASNLRNPFWIDVLNSWKGFLQCNTANQVEDVLQSPIWLNSELQHGEKFIIKNWYQKGIRNIY